MIIKDDVQLDFSDVLIAPQTTKLNNRGDCDIVREYKSLGLKGCPVMTANMTQMGNFRTAKVMLKEGCFATLHKFYTADDIISWIDKEFNKEYPSNLFITVGLRNKEDELKKLHRLWAFYGDKMNILIDVPNAYIPKIEEYVREIRNTFKKNNIAVGNVTSGDQVQKLILCGANIVKVGIGPSQVCDTRIKTGCGRPQLSAIIECANAAHQVDGYIIADGGYKENGDICKALVAGADFCMSGSFFAGTDESNGAIIEKYYLSDEVTPIVENNSRIISSKHTIISKKYKEYYGMSSFRAQKENYGETTKTGTSEGVENKLVPYVGPVKNVINDIKGSIRSCGTYIGASKVKNFMRQGMFYRVNRTK